MVLVTRITEPAFPRQYLCGLDLFEGLTVFGHSQGLLLEYLTAHMAVYHLSPSYSIGRIDTPTSVTEDNPDNLPQSSRDIVPKGDMDLPRTACVSNRESCAWHQELSRLCLKIRGLQQLSHGLFSKYVRTRR